MPNRLNNETLGLEFVVIPADCISANVQLRCRVSVAKKQFAVVVAVVVALDGAAGGQRSDCRHRPQDGPQREFAIAHGAPPFSCKRR